jgi:hypothetical protein
MLANSYEKINVNYEEPEKEEYIPGHEDQISSLYSTPLSKREIIDLKRYAQFYSYWLDHKNNTISIKGEKHDILFIKSQLYFKSTRT